MLGVIAFSVFVLFTFLFSILLLAALKWREEDGKGRVAVVVLGDIGRSPRMQYHALSLCREGYSVDIVGYGGSAPLKELVDSSNVKIHYLSEPFQFFTGSLKHFQFLFKVLHQSFTLIWTLVFQVNKCSCIITQTPPAIPTLCIVWMVCRLKGSKMLVDWHNYGYTLLALALGNDHTLVSISKKFEALFGYMADSSYCVTQAMKKDLMTNWRVTSKVLYDRPTEKFRPSSLKEQHELFMKIGQSYPEFKSSDSNPHSTVFTTYDTADDLVHLRNDRPFLIISSTSWTEDEDFSILLTALEGYDEAASGEESLPCLLCVITGKGPLKEYYEGLIKTKNLTKVKICTLWLTSEDYSLLLGSANLGVSLHKSSSGLDLPMKIVDMFGSGLPVCALQFYCIDELVKHDQNGLLFSDGHNLSNQIQELAVNFPAFNGKLSKFKENLKPFQSLRWDHFWKIHVLPAL
ncbi:chitobiosyldiphosphodolichol beta-mannosyltransferase-like [Dysidea avara]|uniref:chitobiosyldiphosphodolichol beta-mannosyltransferase-like n=1 Tax=Dysidea avara TaxID=196820 RepID=UPI0033303458